MFEKNYMIVKVKESSITWLDFIQFGKIFTGKNRKTCLINGTKI